MTSEFVIAVHALEYLAHHHTTVSSEVLANNICTNPTRIRQVLRKLKKSDLIGTKEGIRGGYYLTRSPEEISLRQICDALNEDVLPALWKSGNEELECQIASGMGKVMEDLTMQLNQTCLSELGQISIADIYKKLFK